MTQPLRNKEVGASRTPKMLHTCINLQQAFLTGVRVIKISKGLLYPSTISPLLTARDLKK